MKKPTRTLEKVKATIEPVKWSLSNILRKLFMKRK